MHQFQLDFMDTECMFLHLKNGGSNFQSLGKKFTVMRIYNRQGGSVMCVCTLSSDPAHLHFSLNCLPNEEEIKKITYQHIVQQTTKRLKQSTLEGL